MKKIQLLLFACFTCGQVCAQEPMPEKPNPVLYVEGFAGGFLGKVFLWGFEPNYQFKNHLISFRYSEIAKVRWEEKPTLFSLVIIEETMYEYSFLYGRRYIKKAGYSLSISTGISYNRHIDYSEKTDVHYAGLPFEVNIKWFKSRKKIFYKAGQAFRSPAFGAGAGFKLTGNLSKESYVGVGLVFSLGTHKVYTSE